MFTLPFLLLLAACGPEKKALRETHREEATLTERADHYGLAYSSSFCFIWSAHFSMSPPTTISVREATVVVRAESYGVRDQVLHSETVVQRWYKDEHDWYVEWP